MIKNLFLFVNTVFFVIIQFGTVQATPMYYTFEGTTTQISDTAGYVQGTEITLGSTVSFTFLFDFERQGEYTFYDGSVQINTDEGPIINGYNGNWDSFYAEYISGDAFSIWDTDRSYEADGDVEYVNSGQIQDWGDNTDKNTWYPDSINASYSWQDEGIMLSYQPGGEPSWELDLFIAFEIGAEWAIQNQVQDTIGSSSIWSNITLVAISNTAPIPEPSTIFLFGLGLLGVAGIGRKK